MSNGLNANVGAFQTKDSAELLEHLLEHVKTLNALLSRLEDSEDIKKYKEEYNNTIKLLGELNAAFE